MDRALNAISRTFSYLAGAMVAAIAAILASHVVARYVFRDPLIWGDEVMRYLVMALTFTGLVFTVAEDSVLKVDAIDSLLSQKAVHVLKAFSQLVLMASLAALITGGWQYFLRFYAVNTPSAQIPRGVFYGPILFALAVCLVAAALLFVRLLRTYPQQSR